MGQITQRKQRTLILLIALCLVLFLNVGRWQVFAQISPSRSNPEVNAVATGRGGAVATVDPLATQIGIEVLKAGGNAIDATVATAAALGVVEPFSAGVGGGGFMVIYLKETGEVITLDGRETAPESATVDMFQDPDSPTGEPLPFSPNRISSGVAVGVPGTVRQWQEALDRYGTISLQQALQPAIALAEQGFAVDPVFARQIEQNQSRFAAFTSTRDLYLPSGQPPQVGTTFRNPDLANAYRLIAQGVHGFYRGNLAAAIVQTVQNPPVVTDPPFRVIPGGMTLADLDRYEVRLRPAVATNYHGYQVYGMGLPSSGGVTPGEVLEILEGFDLSNLDPVKTWHSVIEAERLAFADRNQYLGDPEYVDAPVPGLLSPDYAQMRRAEIGDRAPETGRDFRATAGNPFPYYSDPSPSMSTPLRTVQVSDHEGISTTHLTVADRLGNVVSYTFTLEAIGGSGIVVPGYGFILNNELTDFDPTSPHPNSPEPEKRPRSSMAPTIAFAPDGTVLAFGSPGGSTIITTVLGIAVHLMDLGLSLPEAIAAPRISQRNGGATQVDSGFEQSEIGQGLIALGHILEPMPEIGAATGVVITPEGRMSAAAEPIRRGGGSAMVVNQTLR